MKTGPGRSAALPSVGSMPTRKPSMMKPYGLTSRSNVSVSGHQRLRDTLVMTSRSHLLQYIQLIYGPWDARLGSYDVDTNSIIICSARTGSMGRGPSITRSICPAPFLRCGGSIRRIAVCSFRSECDTPTDLNEQTQFWYPLGVGVSQQQPKPFCYPFPKRHFSKE